MNRRSRRSCLRRGGADRSCRLRWPARCSRHPCCIRPRDRYPRSASRRSRRERAALPRGGWPRPSRSRSPRRCRRRAGWASIRCRPNPQRKHPAHTTRRTEGGSECWTWAQPREIVDKGPISELRPSSEARLKRPGSPSGRAGSLGDAPLPRCGSPRSAPRAPTRTPLPARAWERSGSEGRRAQAACTSLAGGARAAARSRPRSTLTFTGERTTTARTTIRSPLHRQRKPSTPPCLLLGRARAGATRCGAALWSSAVEQQGQRRRARSARLLRLRWVSRPRLGFGGGGAGATWSRHAAHGAKTP